MLLRKHGPNKLEEGWQRGARMQLRHPPIPYRPGLVPYQDAILPLRRYQEMGMC